jgi:predicted nucleic-acid-binding protein
VNITADTSLLVRLLTSDDPRQTALAVEALEKATLVAVTLPALCEVVWVLTYGYKVGAGQLAVAIRDLIDVQNIVVDRPAVEAGLAFLDGGGDFADGVIAYEGRRLGGEVFLSFDRRAVRRLQALGEQARVLS